MALMSIKQQIEHCSENSQFSDFLTIFSLLNSSKINILLKHHRDRQNRKFDGLLALIVFTLLLVSASILELSNFRDSVTS